ALAHAFLDRPWITGEAAMARLRTSRPEAAHSVLHALRFHLVVEIPGALRDMLAELELYWRDPQRPLDLWGDTLHLLYHLYNYQLVERLAETGRTEVVELVRDIRASFDDDDREGMKNSLDKLEELLEGGKSFEAP